MSKRIISTEKAPAAVGPYSQAVVANGFVFTSGQLGIIPGTKSFAGENIQTQARQALNNLKAVLEAAGSGMDRVVKVTAFLYDINDYGQFNEVYGNFFGDEPPARSAFEIKELPLGARVEIEAIALAGE